MSPRSGVETRLAALEALSAVLDRRQSLTDADVFAASMDPRDAAFARRLTYGTLRWFSALDWLVRHMLKHPLKPRDRDIHRLIQLGLYQLWKEDTPSHAAVHVTAGCANRMGKKWAVGLVNALLRRFQRERDALLSALHEAGADHAHPDWLLDHLQEDWPDDWQAIVEANNRQAPLWLRHNRQRAASGDLAAQFEAYGFAKKSSEHAPDAIALDPPAPVQAIPGFASGQLSVQDAAAQLAAPLLAPQPGERVLDACAAPGGKTCHLLEIEPRLALTALDRSAARAGLINDNLERLGLSAQVVTGDAAQPDDWWDGQLFQKILLDAPCSATGVIRRHPEIKWIRTPEQVEEAAELQQRLLDELWPLLEVDGILLYATCSVFKRENQQQIEAFIERHADARCIGPDSMPGQPQTCGWQILPGEADMDGFYYALLRKSA